VAIFRRKRAKRPKAAATRCRASRRLLSYKNGVETVTVIAVLSLMVSGFYKLREPQTLPIQRVQFASVATNTAHTDLKQAVAPYLESNFFTADLQAIEKSLTSLGWVKSASVRRQWPGRLSIRIREQVAVARWGKYALLNRDGEVFRPQHGQFFAGLPVLHGPAGRSQEVLVRYRQVANRLKSAGVGLRALVQDERRAWHLLLGNGIPVNVGRGNLDARVARLSRVYPKVLAPRAVHIRRIDLRYTNGFAVAWKRSSPDG
jgi:cell division protein FtsQ